MGLETGLELKFVEEANNLRLKGGYLRRADIKDILRILRKDEEPLD